MIYICHTLGNTEDIRLLSTVTLSTCIPRDQGGHLMIQMSEELTHCHCKTGQTFRKSIHSQQSTDIYWSPID